MIQFERSSLLLLSLLIFPAMLIFLFNTKKLFHNLSFLETRVLKTSGKLKIKLVFRSIIFALSWFCFVLALAGPSWGTKSYPMQKSGIALSFVFDISHSMEARDIEARLHGFAETATISRLSFAKEWANDFLAFIRARNTRPNVSIVITKGESVLSLPFSQDYSAFYSYVSQLNPYLMTAPGSHLGSGIRLATRSFPANHARFASIILLTDGDDTKGDLEASISEALSYGINVLILGFGSLDGASVLAGGEKQRIDEAIEIETSLKEAELIQMLSRLKAKYPLHSNAVHYFSAREMNSLQKVYTIVNPKRDSGEKTLTSYTIKPIQRHLECLFLSIVFFILGILGSQWNFKRFLNTNSLLLVCIFLPFLNTSCSFPVKDASLLLEGAFYANQDAYDKATFVFIKVLERAEQEGDKNLEQYALYNLSHTYMKQNEDESAKNRLSQIKPDAPDHILFASFYNQGLIAYEKGDFLKAFENFKEALLVKPQSRDAKINLELSLQQTISAKPIGESLLSEFSETDELSDAHNSVFTLIRESEENRWKNNIIQNGDEDVLDY